MWQLDVASSGRGGIAPFVGLCLIATAFGVADGHVQGGMTGDLSLMCPEFNQVINFQTSLVTEVHSLAKDIRSKSSVTKNMLQLLHVCRVWNFQSFFAGIAASGAITSALRFLTKAIFENSRDGLRKGASKFSNIQRCCLFFTKFRYTLFTL